MGAKKIPSAKKSKPKKELPDKKKRPKRPKSGSNDEDEVQAMRVQLDAVGCKLKVRLWADLRVPCACS